MSLSYNDLTLLRYIQKRQMIPLSMKAPSAVPLNRSIFTPVTLWSGSKKVSATAASAMKTWFPLSATWTKRIISAPLMNGSG